MLSPGMLRSILIYYGIPGRARRMRRFYATLIRPGDLCFDVGAHVGNHLRTWLRLGARVVALEPQPDFMRLLRRWYGQHPRLTLIEAAVGPQPGEQTLLISRRTPTVSTLAAGWTEEVRRADSFAAVRWDDSRRVPVTTLDALIGEHGEPAFCKIDVEGYEAEALAGLSRPLRALSFEFIPATLDIALTCIDRLSELGTYEYNWTVGEQMRLRAPGWLDAASMAARLRTLPADARSGDVVARLR